MQKKTFGILLAVCLLFGVLMITPMADDNVIEIKDADALLAMMNNMGSADYPLDGHYQLTGDSYDMQGKKVIPIGTSAKPFTGTFDGNGKTVSNYTYSDTSADNVGFFGYVSDATIKNLTVSGTVTGKQFVGGIAGYAASGTTISGCTNNCNVTGIASTKARVGGIVGYAADATQETSVLIINCKNTGDVAGKDGTAFREDVGGIAGIAWYAAITSCENTGKVEGSNSVGGIVGRSLYAVITDCNNSNANKTVEGTSYIGGIIGHAQSASSVTGCVNSASVTGTGNNVGGIIGYVNGAGTSTEQCGNTGAVQGKSIIGGVVGYGRLATNISECQNSGTVTATIASGNTNVGGIAGAVSSTSTISSCLNMGDVYCSSDVCVGEIIGQAKDFTKVSDCYSDSTVYKKADGSDPEVVNAGMCNTVGSAASVTNCYDSSASSDDFAKLDSTTWAIVDGEPVLRHFCDHNWDNGECSKCGTECDHAGAKFTEVDDKYHKCSICSLATLKHDWENGKCADCGAECSHDSWDEYVCSVCGTDRPAIELTVTALCVVPGVEGCTLSGKLDGADVQVDFDKITVAKDGENWVASGLQLTGNDADHYKLASATFVMENVPADHLITITVVGGTASQTEIYRGQSYSVTVTADSPATGYRFAGWLLDDATEPISTSSTYTMQRVATNDITLTATYELAPDDEPENEGSSNNNLALAIALACRNNKKCVVTYKSTGANDHVSVTVKRGTALAMPAAPTKDGYTFVGWYKDINGTKPFDFNAKITGSVSIYAKWVKN